MSWKSTQLHTDIKFQIWGHLLSKWVSKQVRRFLVGALNVQTQGAASQLTKHKRFQRSFELWCPVAEAVHLCSGSLFHSVGPVVAKQWSPNWLRDLLTTHVMCVQSVTPWVKDMDSPSQQLLHGESKYYSHKGVSGCNNETYQGQSQGQISPVSNQC